MYFLITCINVMSLFCIIRIKIVLQVLYKFYNTNKNVVFISLNGKKTNTLILGILIPDISKIVPDYKTKTRTLSQRERGKNPSLNLIL